MSEQQTNPDELAFLKHHEGAADMPETDSDKQALKQFIDGLDERLKSAGEEIATGTIEGYLKYGGPKPEHVHDPVANPGAIRVKSWHNEEDGTDVTRLLFFAQAVKSPTVSDGELELLYKRDITGQLIEVDARVSYPSQFRRSFGESASYEAGTGFSGYQHGLSSQSEPMSSEEAMQTLSGVLGRFDELLGEAGL
jgi:hypothetical protein